MHSFKHALCFILGIAVSARVAGALSTSHSSRDLELTIDGLVEKASAALADTIPATPDISDTLLPTRSYSPLTNAKRLALGLPLLPPTRRSKGRRTIPSSIPSQTVTGLIQVRDTNNAVIGYIAENTGNNNHFGYTTDPTAAISFSFSVDPTAAVSSQLDISATTTTYAAQWPLMGGIDGVVNTSDDLGTGSANFAYIQGTTHTDPNSPPAAVSNSYPDAEDAESAIWIYTSATAAITAQWVNTDSTLPPTSIVLVSGSNAFVITGDFATFSQAFATSQVVTFTLIAANLAQPV